MSAPRLAVPLAAALVILTAAPARGETAGPQAPVADGGAVADPAPPADSGIFRALIAGRKVLLPSLTIGGAQFVSVKAMAAAVGGKLLEGIRPGDLTLDLAGRKLVFSADAPSLVTFDGGAANLSAAAMPVRDDLYVPSPFIARVLEPMLEEDPEQAAPAGEGRTAPIDLKLVGGERSLKLVFECPRKMPFKLKEIGSAVILRIRDREAAPPYRSRAIGSPLLSSITFDTSGPGRLEVRLFKGPAFESARAFSLKDPFRIVVELKGPAGVPPDPEQAAPPASPADEEPAGSPAQAPEAGLPPPAGPVVPPPDLALPIQPPARTTLQTVVLDPGHGGEQEGAAGASGLLEKEVTLDIARRLRELLRQEGLRAVLTRDWDVDIPLIERTALANRERADLFVSIHVNSSPRADAQGAETYYLAYQTADAEASALAAAENAPFTGARHEEGVGLDMILWDLAQAEHLRESSELAEIVQQELDDELGLRNRGVRQAPFLVLMGATMPAILVEAGFVSNPAEEAALSTAGYRDRIALALARAILRFKETFDRRQGAVVR